MAETPAKSLARHCGSVYGMMDACAEQLWQVSDVVPIVAKGVRTFLDQPHNREGV